MHVEENTQTFDVNLVKVLQQECRSHEIKSGMYFVAPSLFSQMKSITMVKDDVPTSHMHMDEEEKDAIHVDSMEKLHVDEDANDLQDVFDICVVKELEDMHGSDIHQEACEIKVMLRENELENVDATDFFDSMSMVESSTLDSQVVHDADVIDSLGDLPSFESVNVASLDN